MGNPVVPDVYWICAASSGRTSGSRSVGEPEAQNASQSVNGITSRSSASCGRTASSVAAIGLPRYSGTRKIPLARDCFSTYVSSADL